jgi:hypothetical protein
LDLERRGWALIRGSRIDRPLDTHQLIVGQYRVGLTQGPRQVVVQGLQIVPGLVGPRAIRFLVGDRDDSRHLGGDPQGLDQVRGAIGRAAMGIVEGCRRTRSRRYIVHLFVGGPDPLRRARCLGHQVQAHQPHPSRGAVERLAVGSLTTDAGMAGDEAVALALVQDPPGALHQLGPGRKGDGVGLLLDVAVEQTLGADILVGHSVHPDIEIHRSPRLVRQNRRAGGIGPSGLNHGIQQIIDFGGAVQDHGRPGRGTDGRQGRGLFPGAGVGPTREKQGAHVAPGLPDPRTRCVQPLGGVRLAGVSRRGRPLEGDELLPGIEVRGPLAAIEVWLREFAFDVRRLVATDLGRRQRGAAGVGEGHRPGRL